MKLEKQRVACETHLSLLWWFSCLSIWRLLSGSASGSAHGPFKVGQKRMRESKGKKATKETQNQTDKDKKKEVLWCLVYIPQPSCLKYSKICNLYNHPVQTPANNPLSHKQSAVRFLRRCWHRFPVETNGARRQFRTEQILQIMCWSQWHTGSWIARREMTREKSNTCTLSGEVDNWWKTLPGQICRRMKSRCLKKGLDECCKKPFSPFLLTRRL